MGGFTDTRIEKYSELLGAITSSYPDLRITIENGTIVICGCLAITVSGALVDRFLMRLEVDPSYPRVMPSLFEIGGRLPKTAHRHISPRTGKACVCLIDEWSFIARKYPTILDYINGPVKDFFIWQLCYDEFGEDRLGGWSHYNMGRLEFYQKLLQSDDLNVIRKCLLHLSAKRFRSDWLCYCGSGRTACNCHKGFILQLRSRIPRHVARSALEAISQLPK